MEEKAMTVGRASLGLHWTPRVRLRPTGLRGWTRGYLRPVPGAGSHRSTVTGVRVGGLRRCTRAPRGSGDRRLEDDEGVHHDHAGRPGDDPVEVHLQDRLILDQLPTDGHDEARQRVQVDPRPARRRRPAGRRRSAPRRARPSVPRGGRRVAPARAAASISGGAAARMAASSPTPRRTPPASVFWTTSVASSLSATGPPPSSRHAARTASSSGATARNAVTGMPGRGLAALDDAAAGEDQ